jgi:hypothetical protein
MLTLSWICCITTVDWRLEPWLGGSWCRWPMRSPVLERLYQRSKWQGDDDLVFGDPNTPAATRLACAELMSPLPHEAKDLALAPVAVEIDLKLQRLRAKSPKEIQLELETELDRPIPGDRDERAQRVLELALRYVNTRGWAAVITDDNSAVRLTGGTVSLDISVGAAVMRFIEGEGA